MPRTSGFELSHQGDSYRTAQAGDKGTQKEIIPEVLSDNVGGEPPDARIKRYSEVVDGHWGGAPERR
jgi:hypothetical protein